MAESYTSIATDIDPEGVVVFVLHRARLRVSTKVLSLASDVFAAMFSTKFGEGQGIRSLPTATDVPFEIKLPEEEPDVFQVLCQMLHHKTPTSGIDMDSSTTLVKLAIAADKWQCMKSISPFIEVYWRKIDNKITERLVPTDYESPESMLPVPAWQAFDLLVVSAALNHNELFRIASGRLFLLQEDRYSLDTFEDRTGAFLLPEKTLKLLEHARVQLRMEVIRELGYMSRRYELKDCVFDSDNYWFAGQDVGDRLEGILLEFTIAASASLYDLFRSLLQNLTCIFTAHEPKTKLLSYATELGVTILSRLRSSDGGCLRCLLEGHRRLVSQCGCKA